jgi:hypothetical protein
LKRALLASVLLLAAVAVAAPPCVKDGIILFPAPGAVVPTNVQFILEGVGESQDRVQALLTADAIALVPKEGAPIQVKAEKGWLSQMNRVAVRLKPLRPLEPHTQYTLALPTPMAGARIINDVWGDGLLTWTTGAGLDKKPPRFKQKPASSEGFYEKAKDGTLTRKLRLRTLIEDSGLAYLVVTMQRARGSSAIQQYPVALEGEYVHLGHDACSGNVGFDDGRAYKLTFELYDAAGNRAPERATLEVAAPRPLGP